MFRGPRQLRRPTYAIPLVLASNIVEIARSLYAYS
jgi:hypothetical protein